MTQPTLIPSDYKLWSKTEFFTAIPAVPNPVSRQWDTPVNVYSQNKGKKGQIFFLVPKDKSNDVTVTRLNKFFFCMCMFVWVASETVLLAWLQKKREGHVGEWCLTARMIHGGMYAWHTLKAGMMGRHSCCGNFSPCWWTGPTHERRETLFCSTFMQKHTIWRKRLDNLGYFKYWVSQSIMLMFRGFIMYMCQVVSQWCPTLCNLMTSAYSPDNNISRSGYIFLL